MDQYIGKMLDNRYEILERIGMGGMAVVYKAKCHRLNRLVAIKILQSDLAQDADFRRRFNAESQAVAQLSHPNIVSVYDVSKGGDIEYIVMELIDGITLKQYMEKRGRLNWRESLHFITQIMRGLSHAHSRGIVHRDIKPQNIMVLRDGSVKVADFGIACLENSAQTLTQEALGSVHYISPEQARGDRTDARSDIYSAGVVLYEMLAGRLPFEGDYAVSVAIQHLSSIPLPPREVNPEIPEQLELICMKAMAPDINRRYGSADEMILDLEAFRKNPDTNLDFEMRDLRPEEVDEPTMKLRTGGSGGSIAVSHRSTPVRERERRRDYDAYDPPEPGVSKGRVALVAVACVLALALAGVLFRSILGSFQPVAPEQYTVPNVLGYTLENAGNLPEVKEIFAIVQQDEALYSNEYAPGEIVKQVPAAGETRKGDNLEIKVWISAGQETGTMLNLKDRSMAEVTVMMQDLKEKFNLTIEEGEKEYDDEVTEGHVISFEPAEGSLLKDGDTVRVVLSKGPQPVSVISVTGIEPDLAKSLLQACGLDLGEVTSEPSTEMRAGLIIRQELTNGTEVAPGTKVNVVVSSGPEDGGGDIMTYGLTIPLPADRDSVMLQIFQDTECLLNEPVDCRPGSYFMPLEGTGTAHITVYIDGEIERDEDITFGT